MSGIFSSDTFGGLGQTTAAEDAAFSSLISSLATPTTTAVAMSKDASGSPAIWAPASAPTAYPSPVPTDNTALYLVGGVAAVSILAALFMMSRRGIKANRRRSRR